MRERRTITEQNAAIIKALLTRRWYQHYIAGLFGLNQGRVSEIKQGKRFGNVEAAPDDKVDEFLSRSHQP